MKKNAKNLIWIAVGLILSNAALADTLNGTWINPQAPMERLTIHHGVGHFTTECGTDGAGSFRARMVQKGAQVIFNAPLFRSANHVTGYSQFQVHFKLNAQGNKLVEVAPFPSPLMTGVGFWHGASCGFGLTETGASYVKKNT